MTDYPTPWEAVVETMRGGLPGDYRGAVTRRISECRRALHRCGHAHRSPGTALRCAVAAIANMERCPGCGARLHWADDQWACLRCGDEWAWDTIAAHRPSFPIKSR